MSLRKNSPICFVPTLDAERAREFYENTLGLLFEEDDDFAMVFRCGRRVGDMLRVVRTPQFTPAPYTIFGWEVADMHAMVDELKAKGVVFERYDWFEQDDHGVWTTPVGGKVAWFKDPDGNTLSLSTHPKQLV